VRKPLEEEPFILSPGPRLSDREAAAAHAPTGQTAIVFAGRGPPRVPVVRTTVAGRPTMFLVDTGAYDHLLEGWFTQQLQDAEPTGKSAAVIDHANRRVAMDRWGAMSFAIDGWGPLASIKPLATSQDDPGRRMFGIGGILSPQKLAVDGGMVVIDFPAREMVAADEAGATGRLASRGSSLGTARRCGSGYMMAAKVEGKDATFLVDTGSFTTDLKASSALGHALSGRTSVSHDMQAIGGAVPARMLGDARVSIGSLSTRLDLPLVQDRARATRCPSDGVLGMDVLATCVLAIDPTQMRVACN
jgi:predicted aspartyl protease